MELLFDDEALDRTAGVRRVMGTPRKEPQAVLRPERAWEAAGLQPMMNPFFDEESGRFRLWYRARMAARVERRNEPGAETSERESEKARVFICYAESADGLRWERPDLGLFALDGAPGNNILLETGDADSTFWNIVKDPGDPDPARRYKALGFDHCAESALPGVAPGGLGICVAYSADGLRWPSGPKLVMSTRDVTDSDCLLPHREPATGKWVGFFRPRTAPKRRFIGYSESDDFDHWTYPRMLLTPGAGDAEWVEFYGLSVARVGRWRIGGLWVYHNNPAFSPMTTELVYSRDGRDYRRAMPGVQWLPLGPEGAFDSRMAYPVGLVERGGELFIFYCGCDGEHGSDRGMPMQSKHAGALSGLGLARAAATQCCGLRAEMDGVVETKWRCHYGQAGVSVSADIAADGWLQAEVLDQYGQVIPGWDRSRSRLAPMGAGTRQCLWGAGGLSGGCGQKSEAGGVVGHVIKLRFHLHKATLYGFQAGDESARPEYR